MKSIFEKEMNRREKIAQSDSTPNHKPQEKERKQTKQINKMHRAHLARIQSYEQT